MRSTLVSAGFLAALIGCTPDGSSSVGMARSGENGLPVVHSLSIVPNPIVLQGTINAVAEGKDPNQDEVTFRYRWFVNGSAVPGNSTSTLSPEGLKRGDRVAVEATPNDGKADGKPLRSGEAVVGNTPPAIQSVAVEPREPKAGERINLVVESKDPDGDPIRFKVKWSRNNQVVQEGEQTSLETTGFSRDDVIAVSVVPLDQTGAGKEVQAASVTIANRPPKFTSSAPSAAPQGVLEYQATASDSENDPLAFSLESAPPGMTIDERSGRIQWAVPSSGNGAYRVKIVVKDDHQGWASQEFEITLKTPATSS